MQTYTIRRAGYDYHATADAVLPTDWVWTNRGWQLAMDAQPFASWFLPPPQPLPDPTASFELCLGQGPTQVCARASGPAPLIVGLAAVAVIGLLVVGVPLLVA